ncbi:hypothetical protein [Streptomyces sp. CB01580]|uniref:hypothetical protein n=1 Tax=Streptomyces sp. CB01580 TaxID=1703933 RepID=UPI00093F440A|nr:hypothetical protein [Streptomyces sp. CB01580]OKJ42298.1 hypothetical protein AMK22_05145 [Streptomyces sp. CB01580]
MRIYVDPLTAETIPDGTFGQARPRRHDPTEVAEPTHPLEAARRRAILLAELRKYQASKKMPPTE